MKKRSSKMLALVLAAATPGFFAFSCSGLVARESRDAALAGLAAVVEAQTFDILDATLPDRAAD